MAESAELPVEELKIEEEDENSQYKVAAKVSTTDILEKDKDDESLNKWKAQLLADAQAAKTDDPRKVVIREMALMCDGREPIVFDLSTADGVKKMQEKPLIVKEGTNYRLRVKFNVQHEIVMGLRYLQVVKRKGIKVDKEKDMMGCYGPKAEVYEFTMPQQEAPSGMMARGTYNVNSKFTDDDDQVHLEWDWVLKIAKTFEDKE